jgi:hypothetical protein
MLHFQPNKTTTSEQTLAKEVGEDVKCDSFVAVRVDVLQKRHLHCVSAQLAWIMMAMKVISLNIKEYY